MSNGIVDLSTGACARFLPGSGEGPLPGVLIVHGWKSEPFHEGGTYDLVARSLNIVGYHCLLLCIRGHGSDSANLANVTPLQNSDDVVEGFRYLAARPEVDALRLGGFGTSYGAYLLAAVAPATRGLKLLALRAPALYPDVSKMGCWERPTAQAVADLELGDWRSMWHRWEESVALMGVAHFEGDLLLVQSELDEDMPAAVTESYRLAAQRAHSITLVTLKGATHTLSGEPREKFLDVLPRWFCCRYPAAQA